MKIIRRLCCLKFLLVVQLLTALAFIGCGVKGDPVLPGIPSHPKVDDLKAQWESGQVVLSWMKPIAFEGDSRVKILRSEMNVSTQTCPGCPRKFVLIADFYGRDSRLSTDADHIVRFIDDDLKSGCFYAYKVVVCSAEGNCGAESNMAELEIKGEE
jgi:hypothetical protein